MVHQLINFDVKPDCDQRAAVMSASRRAPIEQISTEADIVRGVKALSRKCHVARRMHKAVGTPPIRVRPSGFDGLCRIIVGQQLSVASAAAIWGRCEARIKPFAPDKLLRTREATLKSLGLSAPKIRTLRAASKAAVAGELPLDAREASDADIREHLIAVNGIGPWTADIYLMFCLGRPDAFAAGDLALQIGAQYAFDLDARPSPDELEELAAAWAPWRSIGARLLWAYYAHVKAQTAAVKQPSNAIPV